MSNNFLALTGYSYLTNPWWCMPFETLECFTVSLLGTAAVRYIDVLATPNTITTLQGMEMGIHHGIGSLPLLVLFHHTFMVSFFMHII